MSCVVEKFLSKINSSYSHNTIFIITIKKPYLCEEKNKIFKVKRKIAQLTFSFVATSIDNI